MATTKKTVQKIVRETPETTKAEDIVKKVTKEEPKFKPGKYVMTETFCGQFSVLKKVYKQGVEYDLSAEELKVLSNYVREV